MIELTQSKVDLFKRTVLTPLLEIIADGPPIGPSIRQITPLATGSQQLQDDVQHLAHIVFSLSFKSEKLQPNEDRRAACAVSDFHRLTVTL